MFLIGAEVDFTYNFLAPKNPRHGHVHPVSSELHTRRINPQLISVEYIFLGVGFLCLPQDNIL